MNLFRMPAWLAILAVWLGCGYPSAIAQGVAASATATARVGTSSRTNPLRITQQPVSQSASLGGAATFTVVVSGDAPFTYQWQFNSANISGATNASYTVSNVTLDRQGLYLVRVSDGDTTLTSDTAALLVRCDYALSVTNLTFLSSGGTGVVTVLTQDGCSWAAAVTGEHIILDPDTQIGSGTGVVAFTVAPNLLETSRVGGITIGEQTVFIIQRAPDRVVPGITIVSPGRSARIRTAETIIRGQALDDVSVGRVEFRINDGPILAATGTVVWSTVVALQPGTNTLLVRSIDTSSNASPWITRTVFRSFLSPFMIETSGNGTITPSLNGRDLETDTTYLLTARPAPGWVFAGWSGDTISPNAQLRFVMREGLAFAADFVPSPFTNGAGNYHGLFFESDQARLNSSGQIALEVTDRGSFSCQLTMVGRNHRFSGQFSSLGRHTQLLNDKDGALLSLELQLDLAEGAGRLTGGLTGPGWTADVAAYQSAFDRRTDPAPFAGVYTLLLFPDDVPNTPAGTGFGTVSIDGSGKVSFKGELPDGTRVQESVAVSRQGYWPFFNALYGNSGIVLGWFTVTNLPSDDLTGTFLWLKSGAKPGPNYPSGFTNSVIVAGSLYQNITGEPVLELVNGTLEFSGGGGESLTETVTLGPDNRFVFASERQLVLTVAAKTGLLSGSVRLPSATKPVKFKGAVLPKRNLGGGYFLNGELSGDVELRN